MRWLVAALLLLAGCVEDVSLLEVGQCEVSRLEHEPDEGADRGTILNCSDVQGAGIWEATKACDDILAGVETGPGNNEGNVTWSLFDGRDRVLYETFPADGRESWHAAHSSGGALRLRVETSPDFTGPLAAAIYCT